MSDGEVNSLRKEEFNHSEHRIIYLALGVTVCSVMILWVVYVGDTPEKKYRWEILQDCETWEETNPFDPDSVSQLALLLCDESQIQPIAEEHSDSVLATHVPVYLSENHE